MNPSTGFGAEFLEDVDVPVCYGAWGVHPDAILEQT